MADSLIWQSDVVQIILRLYRTLKECTSPTAEQFELQFIMVLNNQ